MPEHLHALLLPRRADYEMRKILASLKVPVARAAKRHLTGIGQTEWLERLTVREGRKTVIRFWQPSGGFDHNVFKEEIVSAIVEYIHANPVRRGLVAKATDWEWSSARFWEGWKEVPLVMDHPDERAGS
jgi:putative transposase